MAIPRFSGDTPSERTRTIAVSAAVTVWSIIFLCWNGYQKDPPVAEEANIARHLVRGDGFLSPMSPRRDAPPTSWSPPVYPAIIAQATRALGQRGPDLPANDAVTALMVLNSICFGAIAAGIYYLAALFFSRAAALISVILLALHPQFLHFAGDFWDSYIALALFIWALVAAQIVPTTTHPYRAAIGIGAGLGLLSLTNASYALAYPLIVLYALRSRPTPQRWIGAALAALIFALVLLPWTIRNYSTFGQIYYVRAGPQVELWIGNQPTTTGWLDPVTLEEHPFRNPAERRLLIQIGEPAYFRLCGRRFVDQITRDPLGFLARCGDRLCYLFLSEPSRPARFPFLANIIWHKMAIDKVLLNSLVTTLGLTGAWEAWRQRKNSAWPLTAALLASVPFIFSTVADRYTLPLRTLLLFYTGFLLWSVTHRLRRGDWPPVFG